MYEYNEYNKSLFSGVLRAAQHINIITTLFIFSGVRTVIRHLIYRRLGGKPDFFLYTRTRINVPTRAPESVYEYS